MLIDDYLREQANKYRELAEHAENRHVRDELLDLAAVCDEVANSVEDRQTSG
jgi:hypothetical protein